MALICAELVSAVVILNRLGRRSVDRRLLAAIGSTLFAVACLVLVDRMAARAGMRLGRVALDVAAMAAFVWILRCYDIPRGWVSRRLGARFGARFGKEAR